MIFVVIYAAKAKAERYKVKDERHKVQG